MNKKSTIAIIPARSGSKGLKDKNILEFQGLPLFLHSYNYALKSLDKSQVIISTDSYKYKEIAIKNGLDANSIYIRPASLAEDLVVDYPVALHAWIEYEKKNNCNIDFLIWLRPTSPLRQKGLIEKSLNLIKSDDNISSVRAMRKVSEHPYRIWEQKYPNKQVYPIICDNNQKELANIPRQLLPKSYFFQSGEIEVVRRKTLQQGSFSGNHVYPLFIENKSPDIDTKNDFEELNYIDSNES